MFVPSKYQTAFFDWVQNSDGSCVLVAVAGSGKTTSVIKSLHRIPRGQTAKLLAFNSTIAKELNIKIAEEAEAGLDVRNFSGSTFHSLGFSAMRKYLDKIGIRMGNPDDKKCRGLVRDMLGAKSVDYRTYGEFACKLVGLAKGEGIGPLTTDTTEVWMKLVDHHDLQPDTSSADERRGVSIARDLLQRSNEAALKGQLDFDDMLYCPILWKCRLWQNDWVFIDEAQDTNPVRRALAKLALRPGGRLVAVGDPRQAIYGFTGASHDAIDLIKDEFNAIKLPLTVSYRCAKAIVAEAKKIVPEIESFEGADEGLVEHLTLIEALPYLTATDAVLCRQTAPLIKLAYQLIRQGRGCQILGRDIGAGLISLIKRAQAFNIDILVTSLEAYYKREVLRLREKEEEQKIETLTDRVESIFTVVESLPENSRTIPALIDAIENLFNHKNSCLTLSTVHKAKGKEWDTVGILRSDLMPSKFARQEWEHNQEINLIYVARTRAKNHLIYIEKEEKL